MRPVHPSSTLDDVFSYEGLRPILIPHARYNAEVGMKVFAGILLISAWAAPLKGQDTATVRTDSTAQQAALPPYRSAKRALILGSLIPGAGHIYAGEYVRGFLNYEATVGSIGEGVLVFIWDRCMLSFLSTTPCKSGAQWPHQVLGAALVGLGGWMWVSTARDAPRAAERANAKHRRKVEGARPIIQPPADSHSGWRVGAEIHF